MTFALCSWQTGTRDVAVPLSLQCDSSRDRISSRHISLPALSSHIDAVKCLDVWMLASTAIIITLNRPLLPRLNWPTVTWAIELNRHFQLCCDNFPPLLSGFASKCFDYHYPMHACCQLWIRLATPKFDFHWLESNLAYRLVHRCDAALAATDFHQIKWHVLLKQSLQVLVLSQKAIKILKLNSIITKKRDWKKLIWDVIWQVSHVVIIIIKTQPHFSWACWQNLFIIVVDVVFMSIEA